jgi:hypothetical protein
LVIGYGELDKFSVDEVSVAELFDFVIDEVLGVVVLNPFFTGSDVLFAEC